MLGIGFVPVTQIGPKPAIGPKPNIPAGMATTDPGYFFQVVDSPFGGTLPVMFDHVAALAWARRTIACWWITSSKL